MRVAIDLVKEGRAQACVSAGNTGALMGTAKFVLKTLPGIDRPAICAVLPTRKGQVYALDLGANADCTPEHLLQFAIMGSTLVTAVEGKAQSDRGPAQHRLRGDQGQRGGEEGGRAAARERRSTSTATSRATTSTRARPTWWSATASSATWRSRPPRASRRCWATSSRRSSRAPGRRSALALFAYPVIRRFRRRVDPRRYNGAALLGLRGIVVKSHGSADRLAFATALARAAARSAATA